MTDYLEQARQYISESFGGEFLISEESVVDLDQFYCFQHQLKGHVRTEAPSTWLAGQGYTVIYKEDNRVFGFGSRYSLEEALRTLEENLTTEKRIRRYKPQFELRTRYDLQINRVQRRMVLIETLRDAEVTYVVPEVVADSIFRIAQRYDAKLLEQKLKVLPVVFHGIVDGLRLVDKLLTSDCCDFDLRQHEEKNFAKYVHQATEEDLKPIW